MDDIGAALRWALGLGTQGKEPGMGQMALRAVVVHVVTVLMVRLGRKRFMGQSTAFDVILGIMLGSIVSRAITGNAPFFPALAAAAVLLAMHWLFSALAFRSHRFGEAVKDPMGRRVHGPGRVRVTRSDPVETVGWRSRPHPQQPPPTRSLPRCSWRWN